MKQKTVILSQPLIKTLSLNNNSSVRLGLSMTMLCKRLIARRFSSVVVLIALLVGLQGCATNGQGQNGQALDTNESDVQRTNDIGSVVEANPDQLNVSTDEELAVDPKLPKLELDAQTLEYLLLMNMASFNGQWVVAAETANKAAMATEDYRLARLATLLALRADNYSLGLEGATLWQQLDQDGPDALNMLLITQLGAGDIEGAKNSMALHAENYELDSHIKQVAALLVRQKNQDSALALAAYMVNEYDDSAQAALSAAYVAEFFENFAQTQEWVEKALSLKPDWELAAQMQAKALQSQDKLDERSEFIESYVKQHPESVSMRVSLAADMVRKGEVKQAYDLVQNLLLEVPRDTGVLQYAGALAESEEDYEAAARFYQRALNIDPNDDEIRWSLARRAFRDKNYTLAERHFNDIRSNELLFDAQIQVANTRYELYGSESAINTLAGLNPRTEAQYVSLALTRHYILMASYQYEEALGAMNETLYYISGNYDLIYARALVAAELKRLDIAEPDFRAIIEAQPEHANALNALGYTLADQTSRYDEARELIKKALELRPNDAHILDSMGWVAYRQNDLETALEYLEKAYAASEEVEIGVHLGEVLWEMGEQQRAKEIWLKWYQEKSDNRLLLETMKRYQINTSSNADLISAK